MSILSCRGLRSALGLFALCALTVILAANAIAAPSAPPAPAPGAGPGLAPLGGYTGPGPALVTVQEALSMPHDSAVCVKGNIVKHLGRDEYTFTDATGSTEVRIPSPAWQGQSVSEADTVELQGEVRQERTRVVIHVRRVIKR